MRAHDPIRARLTAMQKAVRKWRAAEAAAVTATNRANNAKSAVAEIAKGAASESERAFLLSFATIPKAE